MLLLKYVCQFYSIFHDVGHGFMSLKGLADNFIEDFLLVYHGRLGFNASNPLHKVGL